MLVLATAAASRYRLRELESTLADLGLTLPPELQRYLIATLSDDAGTLQAFLPHVSAMMCPHFAGAAPSRALDLAV